MTSRTDGEGHCLAAERRPGPARERERWSVHPSYPGSRFRLFLRKGVSVWRERSDRRAFRGRLRVRRQTPNTRPRVRNLKVEGEISGTRLSGRDSAMTVQSDLTEGKSVPDHRSAQVAL